LKRVEQAGLSLAAHVNSCRIQPLQAGAAGNAGGIWSTRAALPRPPLHERLGLHSSPSVLPPISELQVDQCCPVRESCPRHGARGYRHYPAASGLICS